MNNVQLLGRLTRDVELRFTPNNGLAVARFNIAINKIGKKDEADFIPVTCFGKTAEIVSQHFKKGDRILISEGKLNSGSYKKENGTTVYTLDVIAERINFIESKQSYKGGFTDLTPVNDGDNPF